MRQNPIEQSKRPKLLHAIIIFTILFAISEIDILPNSHVSLVPEISPAIAGVLSTGNQAGSGDYMEQKKFAHTPFSSGTCNVCHAVGLQTNSQKYPPQMDPNTGKAILARPLQNMCSTCHSRPSGNEWLHAPVAQGGFGCVMCHDPHESEFPSLLISAPEKLCKRCHDMNDLIVNTEAHRQDDDLACLKCHNPHAGKNHLLLKTEHDDVWLPPPSQTARARQ